MGEPSLAAALPWDLPVYIGPAASFLAAALALSLANSRRSAHSWGLLAWSLLLFGTGFLLCHISGAMPQARTLHILAGASSLASIALLLEFGRRDGENAGGAPFFNPSFYVSIGGLSIAGLLIDFSAMLPLLLFAWGGPAFLLSARVFWRSAARAESEAEARAGRLLAGAALLGGAFFCAAVLRWILAWPGGELASLLSGWAFGVVWPLSMIAPLAALLIFALKEAAIPAAISIKRMLAVSAGLLLVAFISSIFAFYAAGKLVDFESFLFKRDKQSLARLIDESINGALALARNASELLSETQGLASYMENPEPPGSEPQWISKLLERQAAALPPQSLCYIMDKRGLCLASSKTRGRDITGRSFAFRSYFKNAAEKGSGMEIALGSATMEPGLFFASAIYSDSKAFLGVAVVKTSLRRCVELAGGDIAMLVDPQGKAIISNNASFEQTDINAIGAGAMRMAQGAANRGNPARDGLLPEQPCLITADSNALPPWRIAILCKPDNAIAAYRVAGMGLAALFSLAVCVAFAMRHSDFWNSVAVKRMLSWRDAILDSQAVGVAILDPSFEFVEANKLFCSMFKLEHGSLKGLRLGPLFSSFRSFESFLKDASEAIASSGLYSNLLQLQARDGSQLWCEVFGRRLEGSGNAASSVWIFIDKTDSKRSNDLLKESEERYKSIFDNAPIGIAVYDGKGPCLMVNPAYTLIAGGSASAALQQDFRRLKSWQDTGMLALAESTLRDGKPRELLSRIKSSFGKQVVARCVVSSSSLGSGRLLVLMMEDQAARDAAEQRSKELVAKYELLFKLMPACAFTVDCAGAITSFNAMAESLTGFKAEELIGKSCHKFTSEPCDARCGLFSDDVKKPIIGRECSIIAKDGSKKLIVKNADVLRDGSGKVCGGIETFFDISEMKQTEAKLKEACSAAENAALAKSEFLARMSQEIRNPVNGILGMVLLLLQSSLSKEQKERAGGILQSSERLLSIMNDILDISKIEAGKLELNPLPTDIKALLSDTAKILTPKAAAKGLELRCELSSSLAPWYFADPFRLRQIVFNLLSNALKFTDAGHVSLRLLPATAPASGDSVSLRIEVEDSGIGIAKSQQPKLFEKFAQAAPNGAQGGSGLGLAICKQLVEMMGGSIGVQSEKGRGSIFHIELPLKPAAPSAHEEPNPAERALRQKRSFDAHALVAEDNIVNRTLASGYLKRLGCRVDEAFSCEMAVEMFNAGSYGIVILDVQMDDGAGMEAAARMRRSASAAKKAIPIIALASSSAGDQGAACAKAGIDGVLYKPLVFDSLSKELAKWLRHAPAPEAASAEAQPGPQIEKPPLPPVVDEAQIRSICAGDPQILESILEVSPNEFAALLGKLEAAIGKGEMQAACIAAHSLKGASANIGGAKMAAICKEAELAAKNGKIEDPAKTLAETKAAIDELFSALSGILKKMQA